MFGAVQTCSMRGVSRRAGKHNAFPHSGYQLPLSRRPFGRGVRAGNERGNPFATKTAVPDLGRSATFRVNSREKLQKRKGNLVTLVAVTPARPLASTRPFGVLAFLGPPDPGMSRLGRSRRTCAAFAPGGAEAARRRRKSGDCGSTRQQGGK